mmetsp:Transcript_77329/g.240267  ORF Transcript_77329/g.240267 Transcript_77329/m.240267 type:complete len:99 (+) Transcript_77329:254-550(+)
MIRRGAEPLGAGRRASGPCRGLQDSARRGHKHSPEVVCVLEAPVCMKHHAHGFRCTDVWRRASCNHLSAGGDVQKSMCRRERLLPTSRLVQCRRAEEF